MSDSINEFAALSKRAISLDNEILDDMSRDINKLHCMSIVAFGISEISNIAVIGCGGTGSWLAPKLSKILNDLKNKGFLGNDFTITYVDGDTVEEKNLVRQNFVSQDIGRNKAEVMAERYSYGIHESISVGYVDKYVRYGKIPSGLKDSDSFASLDDVVTKNTLVLCLIDNSMTRKAIHLRCIDTECPVIDVGNNSENGQLTASFYDIMNRGRLGLMGGNFWMRYPELLYDMDSVSVHSCADADTEVVDQLFSANDMAATVLANYLCALFSDPNSVPVSAISFVTGKNVDVSVLQRTGFRPNQDASNAEASSANAAVACQLLYKILKDHVQSDIPK